MSRAVGVSRPTVANWEKDWDHGGHGVTAKHLLKLADVLGLHPSELQRFAGTIEPAEGRTRLIEVPWAQLRLVKSGALEMGPLRNPKFIEADLPEPHKHIALRVNDTSMEPVFRQGDVFILEMGREPRNGDVVIARWPDGTHTLRTYRTHRSGTQSFDLVPENADAFQTVTVNANNPAEIIGVVVEHHRKTI